MNSPQIQLIDVNTPAGLISVPDITPYTALSIPAYWRAMVFLTDNMTSFPRAVYQTDADGGSTPKPHPLDELLSIQPNAMQDAFAFWSPVFFHTAHTGNGYAEIVRDKVTGRPVELRNLLPEDTLPFRLDARDGFGFRQFYAVRGRAGALPAADVIHLSRLSHDGMYGMNPTQLHENTLRKGSLQGAYVRRFLERGSIIRGAIELPADLDDDQADKIVNRINRYYTGVNAEQDIIILPGNAKLNNAGITPQASQLVEQGTATVKEIAMMTGVPPQFLYEAAEAKYVNTVEQAGIDVVRFTFRPWIERTEAQLTLKLLTRPERAAGLRININPDALMRGDLKAQSDILLAELKAGAITANEYRRATGRAISTDPDADKLKAIGDSTPKAQATSAD